MENEIIILKQKIISGDWDNLKVALERLIEIKGDEYVFDFLIFLISNTDPKIRNNAALAIEELKIEKALEPLLESIFKEENKNYNGTLVFALSSLDCSRNLKDIFKILFSYAYEAKMHAISILDEQSFEFTKKDLLEIKSMWENCKLHPETSIEFDNLKVREEMQSCVDSFLLYLEE